MVIATERLQGLEIKMMGSFLARPLLMVFGYIYPAYECYKFVERQDLEMDQLKFWCQYWIIVALLTTCERVGDNIMSSWLPLYDEVKVAFILYLWHPKTKGSMRIYRSFLKPYMEKHEKEIDLYLVRMRNKAAIITTLIWKKALSYGQCSFFEVLQYAYSQTALRPQTQSK